MKNEILIIIHQMDVPNTDRWSMVNFNLITSLQLQLMQMRLLTTDRNLPL